MGDSELIARDDPVAVERARVLLRSAAKAVDAFEDAVRELVAMRAWDVLGYRDLSEMWEVENGFKCPDYAKVVATLAMGAEGRNTRNPGETRHLGPNGHTNTDISKAIGLRFFGRPITAFRRTRSLPSGANYSIKKAIDTLGSRARAKPRRIAAAPDDLVSGSLYVAKRVDDAIAEIARKADVPKSEIYRRAVDEYLRSHNVSAHYGHASNGAVPEAGA